MNGDFVEKYNKPICNKKKNKCKKNVIQLTFLFLLLRRRRMEEEG